jgi:redox-sensing transcriptional repressor
VQAILNFAPVKLEAPPGVKIRNVDLAVDLGVLSFFVTGKK